MLTGGGLSAAAGGGGLGGGRRGWRRWPCSEEGGAGGAGGRARARRRRPCSCRWPCSAEDGAGAVEAGGERRAGAWRSAERAAPEEWTASGGAADGKIRQPDGRRSISARWSLAKMGNWGKKKRRAVLKQRVFRPGWCHQPGRKTYPFAPVGGTNRT